ncbi:acetyl-CoA C-acyltransferase [Legionella pneumophila]|uniref:Acetyl-CoA C-acetyltransferase n=1 Tax=Legionella pneumophila subsp. pascullei TaxID=91890 RepID=A0AAX2IXV3_LEGPN|nr:acetyl-CoA C-acyltransferase [Legionella pneumophila]AMP89532.1 acetyl-CoA acetyltransferase [Legionella pneumophila subsp. pascullei]AMP92802.1 acetyl-CoA acetyltransferase [Legionella pneumophila subsp. pascullei]AMP95768.1 acetyl-CoA acetyltransferase [Legionella pneumophila subsp. pascullei]SQG90681.1 acetyl-CoA C-acetyltransferase [Legionella pneumophila subsp. pascullei]VEH07226.1 acetyl-CoA C-acetyltransferase [Legionella pneumophila subsp. pascullei]
MEHNDVVIVAAKRTPMGAMLGNLSALSSPELGAVAHMAALSQSGIAPAEIDEVISGCVLQAGIGQAPARQAAIKAGIPNSTGATTINKMCGSGMKAVMLAHDLIKAGTANVVLASGMESMSNAPYLLSKARAGYRLGHGELKDHMFLDGLEDAYDKGQLMGCFAETTAKHFNFSREQQDEFALRSMTRALKAIESGVFQDEIAPVTLTTRKGDITIQVDEGPDAAKLAKIPQLKPAFQADGTVTAANSSSISDGAASLILMSAANAEKRGIKPLAKIIAHSSHSQAPQWFTTAPVDAIRKVMNKASWKQDDVDLFEINEAFAVVAMAAITQLELNPEQVNIHGGACALGHPIGASGARILVTLMHALKHQGKKRGVASLCIGGGEATAMAIELI